MTPRTKTLTQSVSTSILASFEGWADIPIPDQRTIETEYISLYDSLKSLSLARLAVGEHLSNIRSILEPKRMFNKFLDSQTSLSRATAYRYIDLYIATSSRLPKPVLEVVMAKGVDKINLARLESSPPPRTTNVIKIAEWVDSIQSPLPRSDRSSDSPESLKRDCYNYLHSRISRLPSRSRLVWLKSLVGMLLSTLNFTDPQTIDPFPAPEGFLAVRGRPKKVAA